MKKIFSISLLLAAAVAYTSCSPSEEDDIFDKSAAERLNEASDLYSNRLMASPNGWAMQLYPTTENEYPYGNGYLLLCRFNKDHSVNVSMNNVFTENKYMEDTSLWEVITDNGPVLSFNSHNNCLHKFSDPYDIPFTGDADIPNDESGEGVGGDYEFIIVDAPEDASYMMLKGKKRGTYNLLTPIEQGVTYKDYLEDVQGFQAKMFSPSAPTFNVVHFNDKTYKMTGADDGIPNIFPYDGDEIIDESFNAFLITKRGNDYYLRFRDKIKVDDMEVQEFVYKADRDVFQAVDNEACFIEGDNPARFFISTLGQQTYKWEFDQESDKFAAIVNAMNDTFNAMSTSNVKYSYENSVLRVANGQTILQVVYSVKISKQKAQSTSVNYAFNVSQNGDNIRFTYDQPITVGTSTAEAAAGMLDVVPAIKDLINYFGQEFSIDAAETRFLLNTIKLTPTADNSAWVTLKNN
ncbi:MAG: DUF4302 domain-containing protein [Prevotella sp.]|nr:DUF4302 domain-containing protein [Prevotella sp.]